MRLVTALPRRRREILHFEITEPIKTGLISLIMVSPFSLRGGISHFSGHLNSHEANVDAVAPQARNFCALKSRNSFSQ